MAKVPGIEPVTAGGIGVAPRTVQPQITQLNQLQQSPEAFASGKALKVLGDAVGEAGEDQLRIEQKAAADDRTLGIKQGKLAYSEATAPLMKTFRETRGQNTLTAAAEHSAALDKQLQEVLKGIPDKEVRDNVAVQIRNERLNQEVQSSAHTLKQRRVFQDTTSTAVLAQLDQDIAAEADGQPMSEISQAVIAEKTNQLIGEANEMAQRAGLSDKAREHAVLVAISGSHQKVITSLIDRGRGIEAKAYMELADARGWLLPRTLAKLKGDTKNSATLELAQSAMDNIASNPTFDTPAKRTAALKEITKGQPEVRKEAELALRHHETQLRAIEIENDRDNREAIRAHVEGGGTLATLTLAQKESMIKAGKFHAEMRKRVNRLASGKPEFDDPEAGGRLQTMWQTDRKNFSNVDLMEIEPSLSANQLKYWRSVQRVELARSAGQEEAKGKAADAAARETRVRSALTKNFFVRELGVVSRPRQQSVISAVQREVQRRADADQLVTDVQMKDIARAMLLRGEDIPLDPETGQPFDTVFDPDISLYQAINDPTLRFIGKDFRSENKAYIDEMHVLVTEEFPGQKNLITRTKLGFLVESLMLERIPPTPFNLINEIRAQLKKRQAVGDQSALEPPTRANQPPFKVSLVSAAQAGASDIAVDFLIQAEGFIRTAGPAGAGDFPTVGFGNTRGVRVGDSITRAEARKVLVRQVEKARVNVREMVTIDLTPNQEAALISLVFNVGVTAFKKSKALKALNAGELAKFRFEAYDAKQGFVKAKKGGKIIQGLVNRRQAEERLFFKGLEVEI